MDNEISNLRIREMSNPSEDLMAVFAREKEKIGQDNPILVPESYYDTAVRKTKQTIAMKTFTERRLEQIRKIAHEKNYDLSCDIYYDDLREDRGQQFVVKLRNNNSNQIRHFRTNHIYKSLNAALDYVKGL